MKMMYRHQDDNKDGKSGLDDRNYLAIKQRNERQEELVFRVIFPHSFSIHYHVRKYLVHHYMELVRRFCSLLYQRYQNLFQLNVHKCFVNGFFLFYTRCGRTSLPHKIESNTSVQYVCVSSLSSLIIDLIR